MSIICMWLASMLVNKISLSLALIKITVFFTV
jgi:hypothetical protein